jgi:hypothetical protein
MSRGGPCQNGDMVRIEVSAIVAGLLLAFAAPLSADDWISPSPMDLWSPNGIYQIHIALGESMGELVGFKGAKKGRHAQATLTGPAGERHAFSLLNPVAPLEAVLFDDGTLLTFDNWHNMGYGAVLAAYSRSGAVLWSRELEEVLQADVLEKVPVSVSSRWWRRQPLEWTSEDEAGDRWVSIALWNEGRLRVRLKDGAVRYVQVRSMVEDPNLLVHESSARYLVSVTGFRDVPETRSREFLLEVRREGEAGPLPLVFTGPYKMLQSDQPPRFKVVESRLLAYTDGVFAVFDLETGKREASGVGIPPIAPAPDGKRLAYIEMQLPFTPAEASSMIVNVLDTDTLESKPVFPESTRIDVRPSGGLSVWEEDPSSRCRIHELFWSPGGTRLLFFCASEAAAPSLVLVDLRDGLSKSRFVRQLLPGEVYRRPGAEGRDAPAVFGVEGVRWLGEGRIEIEPSAGARWVKERVVLDLPAVD